MAARTVSVTIVPVTPFQQNCSIVVYTPTKQAAVVDPGGDVPQILDAIAKLGVSAERIWLTHGHIDHAGGATELKEKLGGVPIEGPDRRDSFLLESLPQNGAKYGMLNVRADKPDRWLTEKDKLTLGELQFDVLHVPGHTPGSLVYYDASNRLALVGDTLFRGSVGRTDFPYGDTDSLLAAIRAKLLTLGDDVAFLPGHGPPGSMGEEARNNPFVGTAS